MTSSRSGGFRSTAPLFWLKPALLIHLFSLERPMPPSPPYANPVTAFTGSTLSLFITADQIEKRFLNLSEDEIQIGSGQSECGREGKMAREDDATHFYPLELMASEKAIFIVCMNRYVACLWVNATRRDWQEDNGSLLGSEVTSFECCDCSLFKRQCTPTV